MQEERKEGEKVVVVLGSGTRRDHGGKRELHRKQDIEFRVLRREEGKLSSYWREEMEVKRGCTSGELLPSHVHKQDHAMILEVIVGAVVSCTGSC